MSCKGKVRVPGSPAPQLVRPAPLEEKACKTHLLASSCCSDASHVGTEVGIKLKRPVLFILSSFLTG
jgi:hypothetical protein